MEKYEYILPGAAERILILAEGEAEHRREMDKAILKIEARDSLLGIICAFVLGVLCIGIAAAAIIFATETAGTIIGGIIGMAGIGTIISTFVRSTRPNK